MKPASPAAFRLLREGALALADVEAAGIRVDTAYLDRMIAKAKAKIEGLAEELKQDEVWKAWRRTYGGEASLGSRVQLARVLFDVMKFPVKMRTGKTQRPSTDDVHLATVDLPFIRRYQEYESLKKTTATNLKGIRREVVDGRAHCIFSLNKVRTYRSASEAFNFQNLPIRDPLMGKIVRRAFVPSPGRVLLEIDESQIEVRVGACYHFDPRMIAYIENPDKDMHRDMAAQCFRIPEQDLIDNAKHYKPVRGLAKGAFVFAEFYGDYWADKQDGKPGVARNLWETVVRERLSCPDGTPLIRHMARQGIRELGDCSPRGEQRRGSFAGHIRDVEKDFWGRRFRRYAEWKDEWWEKYLERGYFRMHTGFVCQGIHSRNEVVNYPIQGAAFHCLLWSIIQLNNWLRANRMRTLIVGQIHDSILLDAPEDEVADVVAAARRIMVHDIRREWPWIIVPLEVETEIARTNWHEKEKYEL